VRIFVLYPGHASSTIDVADGWVNALKALGHDVQDWHHHEVLTFYETAFAAWHDKNRGFNPGVGEVIWMASRAAIAQMVVTPPDIIIVVTGLAVHRDFYVAVKKLGIPMALILTESPYADQLQQDMCRAIRPDVVFVNERNSVNLYSGMGLRAMYLPHSYDPKRHYPRKVPPGFQSDVCFIGTLYPERKALFDTVDWTGINRKFICQELGDSSPDRIENAEAANYYCGAKICLNLHRTVMGVNANEMVHIDIGDAWSTNPRTFEIAACGGFQIADNARGELEVALSGTVPTFRTARELETLVRYFLSADEERQRIARLQAEQVRGCSFEERGRTIVIPELERLWQK